MQALFPLQGFVMLCDAEDLFLQTEISSRWELGQTGSLNKLHSHLYMQETDRRPFEVSFHFKK